MTQPARTPNSNHGDVTSPWSGPPQCHIAVVEAPPKYPPPARRRPQPVTAANRRGRVVFVGAGPGAPDLLTQRGARAIAAADVVIWASSLVDQRILAHARRARGDRRLGAASDGRRAALLRARGAGTADRRPGALRRPLALGRRPGAARAVRRTRPGHRDRARRVQLHRGGRRHPARADHPGGRPVGDPDPARRRQDADASGGAGQGVRPARHHDGAVPVGRPVRPAAGGAAPGRLPAGHPVRGRLPGDLAGRADRAHRPARPGRHDKAAQALEAHAGPGRPGADKQQAAARTCTTPATSTGTARPNPRPGSSSADTKGKT